MALRLVQGGNTAASAIFGGAVRSEIKAKSQQAKPSANVEAFTLLTLNISEPRVKDLESAITAFTAPETLDGEPLPIIVLLLLSEAFSSGSSSRGMRNPSAIISASVLLMAIESTPAAHLSAAVVLGRLVIGVVGNGLCMAH